MSTPKKINSLIANNKITKKVLYDYLTKKKYKGISKLNKEYLLELYKFSQKTKSQLYKPLKDNNVKGRSKLTKIQLAKIQLATYIEHKKNIDKIGKILKQKRVLSKNKIIQPGPVDINNYLPLTRASFEMLYNNKDAMFFHNNHTYYLDKAIRSIFKTIHNLLGVSVQMLYIFDKNGATPRYTTPSINFDEDDLESENYKERLYASSASLPDTETRFLFIGFKITYVIGGKKKINKTQIKQLKAYYPTNNIEFHKMSVASTSNSGLCIYETWRDIFNIKQLRYSRRDNKNYRTELLNALKEEGNEIEKEVKAGNLVNSLCLLTKKHQKDILIIFYASHIKYNNINKTIDIKGDTPIYIKNGVVCEANDNILWRFNKKKAYLYEKNKHVAPFIFKIYSSKKSKTNEINKVEELIESKFSLKKVIKKNSDHDMKGVLGFDFETFNDNKEIATPYNVCIYGELDNKEIKKSFYGIDCAKELVTYLDNISTKMNDKKSRSKKAIPNIYVYGFNNSRFDNIFIYQYFYEIDPNTTYCFTGSSIKYIRYNNIYIFDMSLFYAGSLADVSESFALEEVKGVFPYQFPNANNINYNGPIPDVKYWKSKDDYDTYIKQNGENFNMKEYTEKYCLLDAKLVYEIAKKHIENATGKINNRDYDVINCPTSANMSIKLFTQVFLNDTLYQSPDKIIEKEKLAYKGGRTEVFKKEFNGDNGDRLYYFDINSSYPSSMLKDMPFQYESSFKFDKDKKVTVDQITDHYLYHAKVKYIGNRDDFIPNILIRTEKGNIIALKETDYAYHWGCELKEAIKNDCEVHINEIEIYKEKKVFDKFANFFYNERLKIKKINPAKAQFFKLTMNSLYGKFGQRTFNESKLTTYDDLFNVLEGDIKKLVDIKEISDDKIIVEYLHDGKEYTSVGKLMRFASYITALGRCKLSEMMRDVGHENVYYCDTDSVFTSKKPNNKYLDNNILGMWKQECKPIKKALFLAPKVYYYETEDNKKGKAIKGMDKNKFTINDMNKLNNGEIDKLTCKMTMFFRTLNNVSIRPQERNLSPVYNKRIWNGNNSNAFKNMEEYIKK